jgi:predicted transcriptional regulator
MSTAKNDVRELLEELPDDASYEEIQYRIYVRQKIEKALEGVEQGQVVSHEEAKRRLSKWLEP